MDGGPTGAPMPVGSLHNFGGQNFNLLTALHPARSAFTGQTVGRLVKRLRPLHPECGRDDGCSRFDQYSKRDAGPVRAGLSKPLIPPRFAHRDREEDGRGGPVPAFEHQPWPSLNRDDRTDAPKTPPPTPMAARRLPPGRLSRILLARRTWSRVQFGRPTPHLLPGRRDADHARRFLGHRRPVRQKPDITAADGVSITGAGGFPNPFFGTSAAAPHAAAIAGLIKSANPSTPEQIRAALIGSAIDIEAPGVDRDSGAGIIDAFAAFRPSESPASQTLNSARSRRPKIPEEAQA